jgi:hypothetical protein
MVSGFVIQHANTRYLRRRPYDGTWSWLGAFSEHATVFTKEAADDMAGWLQREGHACRVLEDYHRREPTIGVAELPVTLQTANGDEAA